MDAQSLNIFQTKGEHFGHKSDQDNGGEQESRFQQHNQQ